MMERTDRHYRFMMRQISRHTLLYTEMVTTGALLHGDAERHLRYDSSSTLWSSSLEEMTLLHWPSAPKWPRNGATMK